MSNKLTIQHVKEYGSKYNYTCLSDIYINAITKLDWICPKRHKFQLAWNTFHTGIRCKICSLRERDIKQSYNIDYISDEIKKMNLELISDYYKNAYTMLTIKCRFGHTFERSWCKQKRFKSCKVCAQINKTGENAYQWNKDRTRSKRSTYLSFPITQISILSDDQYYIDYLNYSKYYNIDHIFPRIAFIDNNLDKIYKPKYIKNICNSRDNLRIITKQENQIKSGKYNQEDFMNWFNNKILYI